MVEAFCENPICARARIPEHAAVGAACPRSAGHTTRSGCPRGAGIPRRTDAQQGSGDRHGAERGDDIGCIATSRGGGPGGGIGAATTTTRDTGHVDDEPACRRGTGARPGRWAEPASCSLLTAQARRPTIRTHPLACVVARNDGCQPTRQGPISRRLVPGSAPLTPRGPRTRACVRGPRVVSSPPTSTPSNPVGLGSGRGDPPIIASSSSNSHRISPEWWPVELGSAAAPRRAAIDPSSPAASRKPAKTPCRSGVRQRPWKPVKNPVHPGGAGEPSRSSPTGSTSGCPSPDCSRVCS